MRASFPDCQPRLSHDEQKKTRSEDGGTDGLIERQWTASNLSQSRPGPARSCDSGKSPKMHPWPPPAAKGALEDELEGSHQSYSGPFVAETGLSPYARPPARATRVRLRARSPSPAVATSGTRSGAVRAVREGKLPEPVYTDLARVLTVRIMLEQLFGCWFV